MSNSTLTHALTITRTYAAPKELMFQLFTQVEHLKRWFCPLGWSVAEADLDLTVGGAWRVKMVYPDGEGLVMKGTYREITRPDKVVFTHVWEKGHPNAEIETLITVTFAESGGKTTMTFVQEGFTTESSRDDHLQGWSDAFVNLESAINEESDESATVSLRIERTFNAPRQVVWDAWTNPAALEKWFGPIGCTLKNLKADIQEGGEYVYEMTMPGGTPMHAKWAFRRLIEPKYMCIVFGFCDPEGNLQPTTMLPVWPLNHRSDVLFVDMGEKTLMLMRSTPIHATEEEIAAYEGMIENMNMGWKGTLDKLDNFIQENN